MSYEHKRNEANREQSRDGTSANHAWNCGVEGPSDDPNVTALRLRQRKNHLSLLLLSAGTPMLLMGDEAGRTQLGNNNAYCHDGPLTWFDWTALDENAGLLRFVQGLTTFSREVPLLNLEHFWSEPKGDERAVLTWHGTALGRPDFSHSSHSLAWELRSSTGAGHFWAATSAWREPLTFDLPRLAAGLSWRRVVDTSLPSPEDFEVPARAVVVEGRSYKVAPRSVVVLVAG